MPLHKSCVKRVKTSTKARERNRGKRSRLRAAIKELRLATSKDEALKLYKQVTHLLDRAASDGLVHKKNADRNKSRFAAVVNRIS